MTNDRRSSFPTYCQKNEFLKHLSLREKKGLKLNILTRFVGKGGGSIGGLHSEGKYRRKTSKTSKRRSPTRRPKYDGVMRSASQIGVCRLKLD